MPKALLDDLEMHTGGHEHDGVGMAETVKGESHKPDAPAVDRKLFGDIVLRRRPFCFPAPGEDKRRCAPPVSQLHFVAVCFLAAEYSHCSLINGDGPSRTGRLQVRRYNLKKLALQMAMVTYTPASFYLSITLNELEEYADITAEINKH